MILILINKSINNSEVNKIKKNYKNNNIKFLNFYPDNEKNLIKNFEYINILDFLDYNKAKVDAINQIKFFVENLNKNFDKHFEKYNLDVWNLNEIAEINNLSKKEWNIFYKISIIKQEILKNQYTEIINISNKNESETIENLITKYEIKHTKFQISKFYFLNKVWGNNFYFYYLKFLIKNFLSLVFFLFIYFINFFIKNTNKKISNFYFSYYPFCWKKYINICDQYYGDKINNDILKNEDTSYLLTLIDIDSVNIFSYIKKFYKYLFKFPYKNKSLLFDINIKFINIIKIFFNKNELTLLTNLFFHKNKIKKLFEFNNINYFNIFIKTFMYNIIFLLPRYSLISRSSHQFIINCKTENKINIFIYLFELSQTRALISGFNASKFKTKIFGFQHSIILHDKLLYSQRLCNNISNNYYPDFYLLDGKIPKEILLKYNFINSSNYKIIGANRLNFFINQNINHNKRNKILFCSGWHDFNDLFDLAVNLLDNSNIEIIFSIHPKISKSIIKHKISHIKSLKNYRNIFFTQKNASFFFNQSLLAITTYSTAGLEAAIKGLPIISYLPYCNYSINLFGNVSNASFELNKVYEYNKILNIYKDEQLRKKISIIQYKYVCGLFNNLDN